MLQSRGVRYFENTRKALKNNHGELSVQTEIERMKAELALMHFWNVSLSLDRASDGGGIKNTSLQQALFVCEEGKAGDST